MSAARLPPSAWPSTESGSRRRTARLPRAPSRRAARPGAAFGLRPAPRVDRIPQVRLRVPGHRLHRSAAGLAPLVEVSEPARSSLHATTSPIRNHTRETGPGRRAGMRRVAAARSCARSSSRVGVCVVGRADAPSPPARAPRPRLEETEGKTARRPLPGSTPPRPSPGSQVASVHAGREVGALSPRCPRVRRAPRSSGCRRGA